MSQERPPPLSRLSAPPPQLRQTSTGSTSKEGDAARLDRQSAQSDLTRASLTAYLERRSPALGRSSVSRAQLELARRSDYPVRCSFSLQFKDVDASSSVYFKYDGQRFRHADATIKIVSGATYELQIVTKPAIDIAPNVLHLRSLSQDKSLHQSIIFLDRASADSDVLKGTWKCELSPSTKSGREEVTLSARLAHFGEFFVPLLIKIYPHNQKKAQQGFKLKMVVFELQRTEGEREGLVKLGSVRYMN